MVLETPRIVEHTLMTRPAITMTTNVRVVVAPDLFLDNEIINLRCARGLERQALAGVSWSVKGGVACEGLLSVLTFVYGLVKRRLLDHRVWLLVGNSAWQPDTRVVRYRKLWKSLAARGIEISNACEKQELMYELDGKLKFFGAIQLSGLYVRTVVDVFLQERCSYMSVLPGSTGIEGVLGAGWSGDIAADFNFITSLIERGGLLVKRFGEFDDEEIGVMAIGRPELVKLLVD